MSHITTQATADLAGITKRQVQRILKTGGEIPGAYRSTGGHWKIPDSPDVRRWAAEFKKWDGKPRKDDYEGVPLGEWVKRRKRDVTKRSKVSPNLPVDQILNELVKESLEDLSVSIARVKAELDVLEDRRKRAGEYLLQVRNEKRSGFKQWVREELKPLSVCDAVWLVGSVRRESRPMGTIRALVMPPESHNDDHHVREDNPWKWITWSSKIAGTLCTTRVSDMGEADRVTAMKHLKPIGDFLKALEG